MQKILCYVALAGAIIVLLLFGADLLLGLLGMIDLAPFRYSSFLIDVVFTICSIAVAILSWITLREQV